jgi:Domain of unknown function (DUF397)
MRSFGVRQAKQAAWRKASFCQSGECVEVAELNGMIVLRDSKAPRRVLRYTTEEWRSFVLGIKASEFDDLGR